MRYLEVLQSLLKGFLFFLRVLAALGRFSDFEKRRFMALILCKDLPFETEEIEKLKLFFQFSQRFVKEKLAQSQAEDHQLDHQLDHQASIHGVAREEQFKFISLAMRTPKGRESSKEFVAIDERVTVLERELQQLNKLSSLFGTSK